MLRKQTLIVGGVVGGAVVGAAIAAAASKVLLPRESRSSGDANPLAMPDGIALTPELHNLESLVRAARCPSGELDDL
jgi:hypothetical protein